MNSNSRFHYHVDEDKRTVVCVLSTSYGELYNRVVKYAPSLQLYNVPYMEGSYVGIARCSSEDIFDPEFGKKLARVRAIRAKNRDMNRKLASVVKNQEKIIEGIQKAYVSDTLEPEWALLYPTMPNASKPVHMVYSHVDRPATVEPEKEPVTHSTVTMKSGIEITPSAENHSVNVPSPVDVSEKENENDAPTPTVTKDVISTQDVHTEDVSDSTGEEIKLENDDSTGDLIAMKRVDDIHVQAFLPSKDSMPDILLKQNPEDIEEGTKSERPVIDVESHESEDHLKDVPPVEKKPDTADTAPISIKSPAPASKEASVSDHVRQFAEKDYSEAASAEQHAVSSSMKQPITEEDVRKAYKFAGCILNDIDFNESDADTDVALQIAIRRIANACAVYIAKTRGCDAISKDAILDLMKKEAQYDPATGLSEFAMKITNDLSKTGNVHVSTGKDSPTFKKPVVQESGDITAEPQNTTPRPISAFAFFQNPAGDEEDEHPVHKEKKQNLFQTAAPAEDSDEPSDDMLVKQDGKQRQNSFFASNDDQNDDEPVVADSEKDSEQTPSDTTFALALYACCDGLPKKSNHVQDAAKLLLEACVLQQKEKSGFDMPSIGSIVKELNGGIEGLDHAFLLSEAQESAKQYRKFQRFDDETKREAIQAISEDLQKML